MIIPHKVFQKQGRLKITQYKTIPKILFLSLFKFTLEYCNIKINFLSLQEKQALFMK